MIPACGVAPRLETDIAIIGAGAAGLAAAIFAGKAAQGSGLRIHLFEGAKKPGAKILVSGGGRCNVTNKSVMAEDFFGGPRSIIRKVLKAFGEDQTVRWMERLGVRLKLEPSGKYFPVSNQARTVLDALLMRTAHLGVHLVSGTRIADFHPSDRGFELTPADRQTIFTRRLIVATGGLALPKSGSDGRGLEILNRMGHTIVPVTRALVPLVLRKSNDLGGRFEEFSGLTLDAGLRLENEAGRKIIELHGSLLFTHLGISGPVVMNFSRHLLRARLEHPKEKFRVTMAHPNFQTPEAADEWLKNQARRHPGRPAASIIGELYPDRFAKALTEGLSSLSNLSRDHRRALAIRMTRLPLEVIGDRGYAFAEATAGGVDLREIDARAMESRKVPGLFLCGEVLDVDGKIGGFNFQWAWSSGYLAGRGAVASLRGEATAPQAASARMGPNS